MSENPFDSLQPPVEKPENNQEKPKNLVTYRKGEIGEMTVDLNNLTPENLQVLSDTILEHEPDSLLGMQAELHNAIVEVENAKGDRKRELEEFIAETKKDLYEAVGRLILAKGSRIIIENYDRGFIEKMYLYKAEEGRLRSILPRIAPFLILVADLDLVENNLEPDDVKVLADSSILQQLTSLGLYGSHIGPEGVRILAAPSNLQQLTSLDLGNNVLGPEGVRILAASPNLRQLTSLDLGGNDISSEGVRALVSDSSNIRQLTSLDLGDNDFGPEGVRILAASSNLQQLTSLNLGGCDLDAESVHVLAETRNLPNLKILDLRDNDFNSDDSDVLADINTLKARGVEILFLN